MRSLLKTMANFLCCRTRKSGKWLIILITLFIVGNYLLLRPMVYRSKPASKNEKHEEEHFVEKNDGIVQNERDDFFVKTIKKTVDETSTLILEKKTEPLKLNVKTDAVTAKYKVSLLIMACNRVEVKRCLDRIIDFKPKDYPIQLVVSQDCGHKETADVIRSYGDKIKFIQQPDLGPVKGVPNNMYRFMGYYKISRHFKWALGQVFETTDSDSVIIVEDDIDIAPDFFDYFLATRPLLDQDETLYCVSAWNDNGKEDAVDSTAIDTLYRSDFFPGLGWMMTRKLWNEIGKRWPKGFWDDWMRAPEQRRGRTCIRPEISRTKTFGRIGVSQGQFYDQYLKYIKLNSQPYPFRDYDVTYLTKQKYDEEFLENVYALPEVSSGEALVDKDKQDVRVTYRNNYEFESLARTYGLMTDFKAGVPRTAYKGIVTFYRNNHRIYIAPPQNWDGYKEN